MNPSIAPQSIQRLKERVLQITGRNRGRSVEQVVAELRLYLSGRKECFRMAKNDKLREELDGRIRRRFRMIYLKQWKRGKTSYRELVARGLSSNAAASIAGASRSYWRMAGTSGSLRSLPKSTFAALGLVSIRA